MRERDINVMFKRIFADYNILTIQNSMVSGWPDKMIQLANSRIVFAEMKHVVINQHNYFRLSDFRNDQAAFFAKWQRDNGKCMLFLGISNTASENIGYGILIQHEWKLWLEVNKQAYQIEDLNIFSDMPNTITKWFARWADLW